MLFTVIESQLSDELGENILKMLHSEYLYSEFKFSRFIVSNIRMRHKAYNVARNIYNFSGGHLPPGDI